MDTQNYEPWIELKVESAALAALLDKPTQYQKILLATIASRRQRFGLPSGPQSFVPTNFTAAE